LSLGAVLAVSFGIAILGAANLVWLERYLAYNDALIAKLRAKSAKSELLRRCLFLYDLSTNRGRWLRGNIRAGAWGGIALAILLGVGKVISMRK
jgi:hypothetical protein